MQGSLVPDWMTEWWFLLSMLACLILIPLTLVVLIVITVIKNSQQR